MNRRPPRSTAEKSFAHGEFGALESRELWLLAWLTALFVGRPLVPSEGVSWLGDGLPWVMLWLFLAGFVALLAIGRGRFATPLSGIDYAVLALVGWQTLAALLATRVGSPRPTVNMLWEIVGTGASFFCARQIVRTDAQARAVTIIMIALAVGLSALAYEQYFIRNPADRAEFAADPDAMLSKYGQWFPPGSREREAFQQRMESKEPFATFALTNSLAGFLTPWFVLLVALMLFGAQPSSAELKPQASRLKPIAAALAAAVLGCLLLTKSRSGWAGVLVGCGGLVATALRHRFLTPRRLLLGAAAIAALVVGAIFARGLDREVLTETGKSLGYRLQYWRSSLGMIQDHPWFGCGPGNFQDYYTAYKLPEASEEIRDPHNFVLELAATAGIPAALAILAVLVVFLRDVWRAERRPEAAPSTEPFAFAADMAAERWMAGGAMVGLILALAIGALVALPFDLERLAIVGVTGAATWVLLGSWRRAGTLRPAWVAMAVVAMAVHHLAAGGINFPGVSGSLWLLLALGSRAATLTENVKEQVSPWRKTAPIAALALASVAGVACFQTGYRPVLREAALVDEISELMLREPASAARQHDLIEAAALADPLASEPYRLLAREAFEKWMQRQSAATKERFDGAVSALLKSQPRSNTNWLEVGQWLAAMYERSHNPADARSAVAAATRAVELYPNSASNRAALAEILSSTGDKPSAITEAKEALRLDEITPHLDKKLKPDVRERMRRTIGN